jgi:hypothetical protein
LTTRQFGFCAAALPAAAVAALAPIATPSGDGAVDPALFIAVRASRITLETR